MSTILITFLTALVVLQLWLSWQGVSLWQIVRRLRRVIRIRRNLGVSWRSAYFKAIGGV